MSARSIDLVDLATRLRIACALVVRAQRKNVPARLTAVQLSALYKVELYGPIRLGELAAREQVAGPTMSRVVTALERLGLVERRTDPTSARCSLVAITRTGRDQIDAVRRDRTEQLTCRMKELTSAQQRDLVAALPALEALVVASFAEAPLVAEREVGRTRRARARGRATRRREA